MFLAGGLVAPCQRPDDAHHCPLLAALGARITGVDDCTFSSTGESFSSIGKLMPVYFAWRFLSY